MIFNHPSDITPTLTPPAQPPLSMILSLALVTLSCFVVECTGLISSVGYVLVDASSTHSQTCFARDRLCRRSHETTRQRQLIIVRPPSRHTYGFVGDSNGDLNYDIPLLELSSLCTSDIQFVPVDGGVKQTNGSKKQSTEMARVQVGDRVLKKWRKRSVHPPGQIQSLFWIVEGNSISADCIAKAASRAVLTHATFVIDETYHFSELDWGSILNTVDSSDDISRHLDKIDIIDMNNPNISKQERTDLTRRVVSLVDKQEKDKQNNQLREHHSTDVATLIHHTQQRESDPIHYIHAGRRTAISPAGTRGAPSQTLRRTHRGILSQYALKNRLVSVDEKSNVSTAMEPEIGFVMCNLAIAGLGKRVLDPCCGSGSLMLYAAALGASQVTGVDSDPSVWRGANEEFARHVCSFTSLPLASPQFYEGDVLNPDSTEPLWTPNNFDAIVCDPPYNIGAPVLVNQLDARPQNYHSKDNSVCTNKSTAIKNATNDLIHSLLVIAQRVLVHGGRIVFFLPVRGPEEVAMSLEVMLVSRGWQSDRLQLIAGRLQWFTPTFARWLVCLEKAKDHSC